MHLTDHRLTVSVHCAGRNLFLCYPDETESIAIFCLENFTVSAAELYAQCCAMLCCVVLCSAVHYFALCDLLCTVQYTVLCGKVVVDVVEVVVAVMPTVRYLRSPIPSYPISCRTLFLSSLPSSSPSPFLLCVCGAGGVYYPCGGAGHERHCGRGATSPLRQVLQSKAVQSRLEQRKAEESRASTLDCYML